MRRVLKPMRPDVVDSVLTVQQEGAVAALGHIFPRTHTPSRALRCSNVGRTSSLGRTSSASSSKDPIALWTVSWRSMATNCCTSELACQRGDPDLLDGRPTRSSIISANRDPLGHGYRCWSRTAAHDISTKSAAGCRPTEASDPFPPHPILLGYERDLIEP